MKTEKINCVILGGGGHAKVLIDALQMSGAAVPYAVLDADPSRWGQSLWGVPILGGDDLLPGLKGRGIDYFTVGLGSVGDSRPRRRLFELGLSHHLKPLSVIHPSAVFSRWAKMGEGSQILPGSVVQAGAALGVNVIVNSGAVVGHDCVLGDHVHVSAVACLAGDVRVGAGAHIGLGAAVQQGVTIGEGAVVGMGAVVVKDVLPHAVMASVPARPLRKVTFGR